MATKNGETNYLKYLKRVEEFMISLFDDLWRYRSSTTSSNAAGSESGKRMIPNNETFQEESRDIRPLHQFKFRSLNKIMEFLRQNTGSLDLFPVDGTNGRVGIQILLGMLQTFLAFIQDGKQKLLVALNLCSSTVAKVDYHGHW